MVRIVLAGSLLALLASSALADNKFGLTYNISIPDGDTADFISETSWRGMGLEWRWDREGDLPVTFGFSMAWHVFSQRLTGTQQLESGAVSGVQDRYLNSLPFLLTAHYTMGSPRGIQLYFGGGLGAQYVVQRLQLGINVLEESNWHFAIVPEAGLMFPLGTIHGIFNVKYDYAVEAGSYIGGDSRDWQYFGVNVGVVYTYW